MKTLFLIVLVVLSGCGQSTLNESQPQSNSPIPISHPPDSGVNVGNGNKPYNKNYISPYHFKFTYSSVLELNESVDRQNLQINNAKLAENGDRTSSIQFKVLRADKDYQRFSASNDYREHLAGLLEYAKAKHQGVNFAEKAFPGAKSYYFSESNADSSVENYYLLMQTFDLVEISVSANSEANGIDLMRGILNSFTTDITSPVFHAIETVGIFEAGKKGKVKFKVTDELSGVDLNHLQCWYFRESYSINGESFEACPESYVSLGEDWYEFSFTIPLWNPAGDYVLMSAAIHDRAGNADDYYTNSEGILGVYDRLKGIFIPVKFPAVTVYLKNNGAVDITPPTVHAIETVGSFISGEKGKIKFKVTDEVSGFNGDSFKQWEFYCWRFAHSTITFPEKFSACPDKLVPLGGDWYEFTFSIPLYTPEGEYVLSSVYLYDEAKNKTYFSWDPTTGKYGHYDKRKKKIVYLDLPKVKIDLKNTGKSDIEPPQFHAVTTEEKTIVAGSKSKIKFKVTDDVSGVNLNGLVCWQFEKLDGTLNAPLTMSACPEKYESLGDNWYEFTFNVPLYKPQGEYVLRLITLFDLAGNERSLYAHSKEGKYGYFEKGEYKVLEIPIVKVTLQH